MWNRSLFGPLVAIACLSAVAFADDVRISGPFTHENLSVYMLHSAAGKRVGTNLLTLGEAMEQKKAAVYETGNVQELSIENLSGQSVFVQAGDIVKGGQQDRVLTTDLMLPPHSGKVSIASFCVEQGRWTRRQGESGAQFVASSAVVPTRKLKMAVREPDSQGKVWEEVAAARIALDPVQPGSAGGVVGGVPGGIGASRSPAPPTPPPPAAAPARPAAMARITSMQLALETRKVKQAVDPYIAALSKVIEGSSDIVGFAYTINGKFSGADVYGSPELFRRMWPKLLHASAAEALTERGAKTSTAPPDAGAIRKAMADSDLGRAAAPRTHGSLSVTKVESDKTLVYVTADRQASGDWLHKSYIAK